MDGRPLLRTACTLVVFAVAAGAVSAQVISGPSRSTPPATTAAGSEVRQSLVMNASATGGWDQDETSGLVGAVGGDVALSGYATFLDAGLVYDRARGANDLNLSGRGYVNGYPGSDVRLSAGGDFSARSQVGVGRNRASVGATARYEPFFSLGAFAPIGGAAEGSPDVIPTNGLRVDRHIWSYDATGSFSRAWNIRQLTTSTYTYARRDYHGAQQIGSDAAMQSAQIGHMTGNDRGWGAGGTYTFSQSTFSDPSGFIQNGYMRTNALEFTLSLQRRLTRTRRLTLTAGAGPQQASGRSQIAGAEYSYWTPSAQAALQLDIGRAWAFTADYRRGTMALESINRLPFSANTVLMRAGGHLGQRANAALSVGYSGGQSGAIGETGGFSNYTGAAEFGFNMSRCCSTVFVYSFYNYHLADLVDAPGKLPRHFTRGAVRGGMTINLPLQESRRESSGPRRRGGS